MRRIPIRLRVAGAFAIAMAIVFAGTGLFLYARLSSRLTQSLDHNLQLRAQDLAALVRESGGSLAAAAGGRFIEQGEAYAQLLDAHGRVLDGTGPLRRNALLSKTQLRAARAKTLFVDRRAIAGLDEPSRLLATSLQLGGQPLVLVVGATRQDRVETLASLRDELLIAGPAALLLASLVGYFLAGLALRPVESMRRRAAAISAETPGRRLPVPRSGDEVERLGKTLNAMLARLEEALQREREFVADAGHELRTPLALLRTELELALRQAETPEQLREAIRRSSSEADRLSQLAEDLLLIARTDRGSLSLQLEDIEVDELFAGVRSRFEWRAEETGRPVEAAPSGLRIRGDRLRLEQALGNLVDNALRYGEGPVRLSARNGNGRIQVQVADEGSGFPPEFLGRAFDRFTCADPARSNAGAGLGLAIVRAIAEAHGGSAEAANDPQRGANVWLELPTNCLQRPLL